MTSDPSNYHREYSPYGSYSLFQFEGSDVISAPKKNCPQNSDRVQPLFQSPKRCITKHLKHTKLYSIEFLRTEMTSDPSNYHREYWPYGSYSLFQFEGSDVISAPKNSIEYSFVFFKR